QPHGQGTPLLPWLTSCWTRSTLAVGPSKVTGTVGGSLTVQCHYGEEFKDNDKLWCKKSLVLCKDVVKTRGSEGEVQSVRVSISDHPENLSFTVTMERLTLEDAGSYECGVDTPWHKGFDLYFKVEVAVLPGEPLPAVPGLPGPGHLGKNQKSCVACTVLWWFRSAQVSTVGLHTARGAGQTGPGWG
uniref:Ig-like domain-containing protein n=1 Tax=Spermophilus dauricus TaxID=99837 RepID=A0A8C9QTA7_SPEDA